ncbi:MAG TPA: hypothetical protein VKI41_02040 [Vicinamibacteria bacterium]|nr:hypothetical protein [Vicinamibacteria bacterium]
MGAANQRRGEGTLDTRGRVPYHLGFGNALMNMPATTAERGKEGGPLRRWRLVFHHHRYHP